MDGEDMANPVAAGFANEEILVHRVEDTLDARGWGSSFVEDLLPPNQATMPVDRDAHEYNMNHEQRGKAIIFNHKNFTVESLSVRNGTDLDRDRLAETLKNLDFDVEIYEDLSVVKVLDKIHQVSLEDHSNRDCLLIAVFSHGIPHRIYAVDGTYKSESLWDPFTADRCPSLAGKPKIFLIQACQGEELDHGTTLKTMSPSPRSYTVTDSAFTFESYKIPNRADFLMVFSTFPGYYSWRNQSTGSWFIQSICEVFSQYGNRKDLQALITMASRAVALRYESYVPNSRLDQMKQMPFVTSTLIREVYFTPKRHGECTGSIKNMTGNASEEKPKFQPFFSLVNPKTSRAVVPDGDDDDDVEDYAGPPSRTELPSKVGNPPARSARMSLVRPHEQKKSQGPMQ